MIIVTGDLLVKDGAIAEALDVCLKHVAYSRTELGCISHHVYQDPENPLRLFFMSNGKIKPLWMLILLYLALRHLLLRHNT